MAAKFSIGQFMATKGALNVLAPEDIILALKRHIQGDWGDVCPEDKLENELSLQAGLRLVSVYHSVKGIKFYIITEADRLATTVLLPEEY